MRETKLMIPAKTRCPNSDWVIDRHFRTSYVCVDEEPESVTSKPITGSWFWALLYPVAAGPGLFPYMLQQCSSLCILYQIEVWAFARYKSYLLMHWEEIKTVLAQFTNYILLSFKDLCSMPSIQFLLSGFILWPHYWKPEFFITISKFPYYFAHLCLSIK